jgi:hypothetical protein
MAEYNSTSIFIGTLAGIISSIVAAFFGFSGPGILTSNFVAGFTALIQTMKKNDYILNGGLSEIMSSVGMIFIGLLFNGTPVGFSNWNTLGLVSLGLSIGGAGFFIGIIGGYVAIHFSN